jgi:D-ribose pyranose/furanose isomerase RbsD
MKEIQMKLRQLYLLAITCLLAFSGQAATLDLATIDTRAKWVVHIDINKISKTATGQYLGKFISELPEFPALVQQLNKSDYADIIKNVADISVFGSINCLEDDGIILVHGNFDMQQMRKGFSKNTKTLEHNDHTIIMDADMNIKTKSTTPSSSYAVIYNSHLIVCGMQLQTIKSELDVLDGKTPSIKGSLLAESAADISQDAFALVTVNIADARALNPSATIMKTTKLVAIGIGESGSNITARATLYADNKENAESLKKMAEGMLAFISMDSSNESNQALLNSLKNMTLSTNNTKVTATWKCPVAKAIDIFEARAAQEIKDNSKTILQQLMQTSNNKKNTTPTP